MLVQRWSSVCDAGPALNQHLVSALCSPGCICRMDKISHLGIMENSKDSNPAADKTDYKALL